MSIYPTQKHWLFALALCVMASYPGVSAAYAPEHSLLEIKGFSPETVNIIETQTDRMEWKRPSPPERPPSKQFLRNVFINDWTGNFDPFGSHILRERQ